MHAVAFAGKVKAAEAWVARKHSEKLLALCEGKVGVHKVQALRKGLEPGFSDPSGQTQHGELRHGGDT